ncbi:hypothetical protein GGR52DRAFT_558632 [Hypoxylon sp. FL1284]|nr:hypothetical protein GGR52DRAFT_558632 [Hypoxylon sp. FL1284]
MQTSFTKLKILAFLASSILLRGFYCIPNARGRTDMHLLLRRLEKGVYTRVKVSSSSCLATAARRSSLLGLILYRTTEHSLSR